jgi:hypothetical protein
MGRKGDITKSPVIKETKTVNVIKNMKRDENDEPHFR